MKLIDIGINGETIEMLVDFDQQKGKTEEFIRIYQTLADIVKKAGLVLEVEFVKNLYEKEFWSKESSSMGIPVLAKGWREKNSEEFSFFERKYASILGKKNPQELRIEARKFFGAQ